MTYNAPELVLSKKLLSAHKTNGFTSAIIEGSRGIGKSAYALKVFYDVFEFIQPAHWSYIWDY
jgi:Cdc6-like AAA superfamily ATPase